MNADQTFVIADAANALLRKAVLVDIDPAKLCEVMAELCRMEAEPVMSGPHGAWARWMVASTKASVAAILMLSCEREADELRRKVRP